MKKIYKISAELLSNISLYPKYYFSVNLNLADEINALLLNDVNFDNITENLAHLESCRRESFYDEIIFNKLIKSKKS